MAKSNRYVRKSAKEIEDSVLPEFFPVAKDDHETGVWGGVGAQGVGPVILSLEIEARLRHAVS
jgi:hypothetical protein